MPAVRSQPHRAARRPRVATRSPAVRRQPPAAPAVRRARPASGADRAAARRLPGLARQSPGDLRPAGLRRDRARDADGALSAAEARPEVWTAPRSMRRCASRRTPGEPNLFDRMSGDGTAVRTQRRLISAALGDAGGLYEGAARGRDGVRPRPGRHRQDLSGGRRRRRHAEQGHGRPHRAVAPGGRGRRAARLPARRPAGKGRSLSAAALRRALRHDAGGAGDAPPDQRRDRDRAARLHARPHLGQLPSSSSTRRRTPRRCR